MDWQSGPLHSRPHPLDREDQQHLRRPPQQEQPDGGPPSGAAMPAPPSASAYTASLHRKTMSAMSLGHLDHAGLHGWPEQQWPEQNRVSASQ
jgi:hypothetical protein